jgi:hypothetical protein
MLATTRQVFTSYDMAGDVIEFDSSAYPIELIGGPQQTF